jgi:hypothetical protein
MIDRALMPAIIDDAGLIGGLQQTYIVCLNVFSRMLTLSSVKKRVFEVKTAN